MAFVGVAAFVLEHLLVLAMVASTCLAAGLPWLRRLAMTGPERTAVAVAIGLAMVGHAALVLGLVGRLEPVAILVLALLAHVIARRDLGDLVSAGLRRAWRSRRDATLGVLALSPVALGALYPPLAFDETLYHLPYARAFVRARAVPFLADLRFPVFPQFVEACFAAVLALAGDVTTHLVSLTATLATALLVAAWGRRAAERAGGGVPGGPIVAGGLAAAMVLGQPIGVYLAGTGYVEPVLALFVAAALYAADRWRREAGRAWLVLAGLCGGTAAACKYTGLLVLAGVSILVAREAARRRAGRDVLVYGSVVLATTAVSYGRLLYHTGNPVFPFLPQLFGSTPWDASALVPKLGLQHGVGLLALPWAVVFDRHALGGLPPFSPLWPVGLAVVLVAGWWNRDVRGWAPWIVGLILFEPLYGHYLWIGMPILALAFGVSGVEILGRLGALEGRLRPARAAWAAVLVALCLLPGWVYGVYRLIRLGPMPADGGARATFLAAQLPLFSAVNFLNERCGDRCTVYGVHAEHMVYFAAGRYLGDWNGPASFARTLPADGDVQAFARRLQAIGAEYVLVPRAIQRLAGLLDTDAPGFRRIYSDRAADVYALSSPGGPR